MPTTLGHYEFTIQVSCRGIGERDFVVDDPGAADAHHHHPVPGVSGRRAGYGRISQLYGHQLFVSGGSGGTVHWRIASGTLPNGLSLSETGLLGGTRAGPPGLSSFTIEATQAALRATLATSIYIRPPQLVISPAHDSRIPDAAVGALSTVRFQATGGSEPYHWDVYTVMPTSSIAMDPATGELTFIPTTAGDYDIFALVSDGLDGTAALVHVTVVGSGSQVRIR